MCSFGYTFFNFGGFTMNELKVSIFSKVLRESINENIHKVVKEYAEYLEPAKEVMINTEATSALYKIKKIIFDEALSDTEKVGKIRDVFDTYNLDFESFEY